MSADLSQYAAKPAAPVTPAPASAPPADLSQYAASKPTPLPKGGMAEVLHATPTPAASAPPTAAPKAAAAPVNRNDPYAAQHQIAPDQAARQEPLKANLATAGGILGAPMTYLGVLGRERDLDPAKGIPHEAMEAVRQVGASFTKTLAEMKRLGPGAALNEYAPFEKPQLQFIADHGSPDAKQAAKYYLAHEGLRQGSALALDLINPAYRLLPGGDVFQSGAKVAGKGVNAAAKVIPGGEKVVEGAHRGAYNFETVWKDATKSLRPYQDVRKAAEKRVLDNGGAVKEARAAGVEAEAAMRNVLAAQTRGKVAATKIASKVFSGTSRDERMAIEDISEHLADEGEMHKVLAEYKSGTAPFKVAKERVDDLLRRASMLRGTYVQMTDDQVAAGLLDTKRVFDPSKYTYRGGALGDVYKMPDNLHPDVVEAYQRKGPGTGGMGTGSKTGGHKDFETLRDALPKIAARYDPADQFVSFVSHRSGKLEAEEALQGLKSTGLVKDLDYGEHGTGVEGEKTAMKVADKAARHEAGAQAAAASGVTQREYRSAAGAGARLPGTEARLTEAQRAAGVVEQRTADLPGKVEAKTTGPEAPLTQRSEDLLHRSMDAHMDAVEAKREREIALGSTPPETDLLSSAAKQSGYNIADSIAKAQAHEPRPVDKLAFFKEFHRKLVDERGGDPERTKYDIDKIDEYYERYLNTLRPLYHEKQRSLGITPKDPDALAAFNATKEGAARTAKEAKDAQRHLKAINEAWRLIKRANVPETVARVVSGTQGALAKRVSKIAATAAEQTISKAKAEAYVSEFAQIFPGLRTEFRENVQGAAERRAKEEGFTPLGGQTLARTKFRGSPTLQVTAADPAVVRFLEKAGAPRPEAEGIGALFGGLNRLARIGIITNPLIHAGWNLGTHFMAAGGSPAFFAHGLWRESDPHWTERAEKANAVIHMPDTEPIFGGMGGGGYGSAFLSGGGQKGLGGLDVAAKDAIALAKRKADSGELGKFEKYLPDRVRELLYGAGGAANRAASESWKWNNHLVFETFEKRYSVELFRHLVEERGMTDAAAGIQVRKALGDYANVMHTGGITDAISRSMLFYPWLKTALPFWAQTLVTKPQYVTIPYEGIRRFDEAMGDPQAAEHAERLTLFEGSDPKTGEAHLRSFPGPQKFALDLIDIAHGIVGGGKGTEDLRTAGSRALGIAETHLAPFSALGAADAAQYTFNHPNRKFGDDWRMAFQPGDSRREQAGELAQFVGGRLPFVAQAKGIIDSIVNAKEDPTAVTGLLGGTRYKAATPLSKEILKRKKEAIGPALAPLREALKAARAAGLDDETYRTQLREILKLQNDALKP